MSRKPPRSLPYTDLKPALWREYEEILTGSLWIFPTRYRGDGHALEYHGNFVPQIATQTLLRFTRPGDVVLDLFLGAGTTAVEAVRLGRRCVGIELRADLVEHVRQKLAHAADQVALITEDATSPALIAEVRSALAAWDREAAQLLILHPPYHDIIPFSHDPADLSNAGSVAAFLDRFALAAEHGIELLEPGRFAVLVIGDTYRSGEWIPLGFLCMERLRALGLRLKSICVKNIEGNEIGKGRATPLWRYRALAGGFYLFKHEYVMIFQKKDVRRRGLERGSQ
ncbi:MAG: DNA methylase [Armatimonadetes bacterium]|nr:DNA methylase [Armatimonadota bacterium]